MKKDKIPILAKNFMLPTSRFDSAKADYVAAFIGALRHMKGEWSGQPFELLPWQRDFIRTVFGAVGADGYRQCRAAYVEIGKKNGKTMLAAALALYLLISDGEIGAEIYSCAADRQQASLIYLEAAIMAKKLPRISETRKSFGQPKADNFFGNEQFLSSFVERGLLKTWAGPTRRFV